MNRKKIVAGNWKMNLLQEEAIALTKNIIAPVNVKCELIIAPPYIYLLECLQHSGKNKFKVSAQNCSEHSNGAFTGEVSISMLQNLGVTHCIVGHHERRKNFGETDITVAKKTISLLEHGMTPIVCVGETLEERNDNIHLSILENQIATGLFGLSESQIIQTVIAYEPVWAIGTGLTATPSQAQEIHAFLRNLIATRYSQEIANAISILYGGSCNESNAKELFACKDIDGGLIGGASLKAESFLKIASSF